MPSCSSSRPQAQGVETQIQSLCSRNQPCHRSHPSPRSSSSTTHTCSHRSLHLTPRSTRAIARSRRTETTRSGPRTKRTFPRPQRPRESQQYGQHHQRAAPFARWLQNKSRTHTWPRRCGNTTGVIETCGTWRTQRQLEPLSTGRHCSQVTTTCRATSSSSEERSR